jgi:hypothetical protein
LAVSARAPPSGARSSLVEPSHGRHWSSRSRRRGKRRRRQRMRFPLGARCPLGALPELARGSALARRWSPCSAAGARAWVELPSAAARSSRVGASPKPDWITPDCARSDLDHAMPRSTGARSPHMPRLGGGGAPLVLAPATSYAQTRRPREAHTLACSARFTRVDLHVPRLEAPPRATTRDPMGAGRRRRELEPVLRRRRFPSSGQRDGGRGRCSRARFARPLGAERDGWGRPE